MNKFVKTIFAAAVFIFFTAGSSPAQLIGSIAKIIESSSKSDILKHAQWSLYARYINSEKPIIDYNSGQSLAPASGLKVFTSIAALSYLGEDFKFTTRLFYDGEINTHGVLRGNIYIVGSGDPTLGSARISKKNSLDSLMFTWTNAVRKIGIKKIEGSIIADVSHFDYMPIPGEWVWTDIGNYYGAGASALSINENLYKLYFKPGAAKGENASVIRTEPAIPGLKFMNYMKTGAKGSGDNGYIFCAPGQYNAILNGTIPTGEKEFVIKGAIPDPALFAVQYFEESLYKFGIKTTKPVKKIAVQKKYDLSKRITSISSPALKEIVYYLNKKSINLYAEALLKEIAFKQYGIGSTKKGIDAVKEFLEHKNIDVSGFKIYDGSGLSRADMITSKIMVDLLTAVSKEKFFQTFFKSLAVAGDPNDIGYFSNFGKGTEIAGNARIKSGLIDRVRSHSGYVKDSRGRMITFSFIVNNHSGSHRYIDKIHRDILIELAKLK